MIITSLELVQFTRLALNDIKTFTYKPFETTNYILGLNGSGKSSIISELTPLPANLKNYGENGYKRITIVFDSKEYVLTSGLIHNKHEFLVDGEDLNISNNKKEQLLLVKEHFGITPDTFKVSSGISSLTTMSISERRKYFSNISTVDYAYAIKTYNAIKANHRDTIGGIKILQSKINGLELSKLSVSERESYNKSLELLTNLATWYNNNIKTEEDIPLKDMQIGRLEKVFNKLITLNKPKESISVLKGIASTLEKELQEVTLQLETIKVEDVNEEELLRHNNLSNALTYMRESLPVELRTISDDSLDTTLFRLNESLEKANMYADTINHIDSTTSLSDFQKRLKELVKDKLKEENDLVVLKEELLELTANKKNAAVECPNCTHKWKVGYDEKRETSCIETIRKKETRLKTITEQYMLCIKNIEEREHNNMVLDKLTTLLKPFTPNITLPTVKETIHTLMVHRETFTEYVKAMKEFIILDTKINTTQEINNKTLDDTVLKLESRIESLFHELENVGKRIAEAEKFENYTMLLRDEFDTVVIYLRSKKKASNAELVKAINGLYLRNLQLVKNAIKEMEVRLNDEEFLEREIASLTKTLKEEVTKEEVLKKMVVGLSPTNGLIAKSINGFLGKFVELVNQYLAEIWSYPLQIFIPDIENNELSYTFKVNVDGVIVDDISLLSTGQQEVINRVNIIVMLMFLRQETYPIMLDEPFITLSPVHRDNAFKLVDNLDRQKFIVSHSDNAYMLNSKTNLTIFIGNDERYNSEYCIIT